MVTRRLACRLLILGMLSATPARGEAVSAPLADVLNQLWVGACGGRLEIGSRTECEEAALGLACSGLNQQISQGVLTGAVIDPLFESLEFVARTLLGLGPLYDAKFLRESALEAEDFGDFLHRLAARAVNKIPGIAAGLAGGQTTVEALGGLVKIGSTPESALEAVRNILTEKMGNDLEALYHQVRKKGRRRGQKSTWSGQVGSRVLGNVTASGEGLAVWDQTGQTLTWHFQFERVCQPGDGAGKPRRCTVTFTATVSVSATGEPVVGPVTVTIRCECCGTPPGAPPLPDGTTTGGPGTTPDGGGGGGGSASGDGSGSGGTTDGADGGDAGDGEEASGDCETRLRDCEDELDRLRRELAETQQELDELGKTQQDAGAEIETIEGPVRRAEQALEDCQNKLLADAAEAKRTGTPTLVRITGDGGIVLVGGDAATRATATRCEVARRDLAAAREGAKSGQALAGGLRSAQSKRDREIEEAEERRRDLEERIRRQQEACDRIRAECPPVGSAARTSSSRAAGSVPAAIRPVRPPGLGTGEGGNREDLERRLRESIIALFSAYEAGRPSDLIAGLSPSFRSRDRQGFGYTASQMGLSLDGDARNLSDVTFEVDVQPPRFDRGSTRAQVDVRWSRRARFAATGQEWILRNQSSRLVFALDAGPPRLASIEGAPVFGLTSPVGVLRVGEGTIDGTPITSPTSVLHGRLGAGGRDLEAFGIPTGPSPGAPASPAGASNPPANPADLEIRSADLAVTPANSPGCPYTPGQVFTTTVVVSNGGGTAAGPFQVQFALAGLVVTSLDVTGLDPGQQVTLVQDLTAPGGTGTHLLRVHADPAQTIGESTLTNNVGSRSLSVQ